MLDVLIRGGTIVDGTGSPGRLADLGIEGERIVEVAPLAGALATRVIDATGKIVAPGLIDSHSHSDWSIQSNPTAESTVRQGVTTEIVGQCGWSNAPVSDASRELISGRLRTYAFPGAVDWSTTGEYLEFIARLGTSSNLGWMVGHNAIRAAAGVVGPLATEDQIRQMEGYVAEAMDAGCLGLSTGLEFEPGRTAPTDELVRLAQVAGRSSGIYTSHIRNRDARILEAIDECLGIARAGNLRAVVSHLNVRYNTGAPDGAWERAVGKVEQARRSGLDVLADATPYTEGIGQMAGILPPWVLADGPARAAEALRDPAIRARLRDECDRYWRFIHRGDWHRVKMLGSAEFPELSGKSFAEVSEIWGKDPWDCYFDVLAAAGAGLDSVIVVAELFTKEHVAEMVRHPLFSLGVDSFTSRTDGPLAERTRHPLSFAGMLHYLAYHVREAKTLSLEEAIRKMTSQPADHHGLQGRGRLASGAFADVVIFDLARLEELSTLDRPLAYSRGFSHVLVNGVVVVDEGEHTGARPGRNLLRSS